MTQQTETTETRLSSPARVTVWSGLPDGATIRVAGRASTAAEAKACAEAAGYTVTEAGGLIEHNAEDDAWTVVVDDA